MTPEERIAEIRERIKKVNLEAGAICPYGNTDTTWMEIYNIAHAREDILWLLEQIAAVKTAAGRIWEQWQKEAEAHKAKCERIAELESQLSEAKAAYNEEIAEFSAGFEAYKQGVLYENEPNDTKYDVWCAGWAWAAFEPMRAELREAKAENERLKNEVSALVARKDAYFGELVDLRGKVATLEAEIETAKAEGRREGLEIAVTICRSVQDDYNDKGWHDHGRAALWCVNRIQKQLEANARALDQRPADGEGQ